MHMEVINNHLSVLAVTKQENQYSIRSPKSDNYQWQFHLELINFLEAMLGPQTIDIFASVTTAHTTYFNTRYYHPSPSGVNALAQQYCTFHNNFVNEPVCLKLGYWTYAFRRQTQPQSH